MDRSSLTYVVPLALLSLVGGSTLQAWNALHPKGGAEVVVQPIPQSTPVAPEAPQRLLSIRGKEKKSASVQLKKMQAWLRQQKQKGERSQVERKRLQDQLIDSEDSIRQLKRQVVLQEAVIQAGRHAPEPVAAAPVLLEAERVRAEAWEERARRLILKGSYRPAGDAFCRALWLNPADPVLHYNLGLLCGEILGEPGRALYHYRLFLALAPDDPLAPAVRRDLERLERLGEGN